MRIRYSEMSSAQQKQWNGHVFRFMVYIINGGGTGYLNDEVGGGWGRAEEEMRSWMAQDMHN